jgi:hypothetical protein
MAVYRQSAQSKQAVLIQQRFKLNGAVADPSAFTVQTAWLPEGTVPVAGTTWYAADWEPQGAGWAVRTIIGPGGGVVTLAASGTPYIPYAKLTTATETIVAASTDRLEIF